MNKKNYKQKLDIFRKEILQSTKSENKNISNVLKWIKKRKKADKTEIKKTNLVKLKDWSFDNKVNINHKSGQFFSVKGVTVNNAYNREVKKWDQPLFFQKHGGILAMLCRKNKGVVEFLLLARREPGDRDLKLCPSFSATQSNLNRAHGGKSTDLYRIILDKNRNTICETEHYEEGARFYQKKNKNIIIRIKKKDEKKITNPNYIWLSLTQIKKLNLFKGILNPFVKTILFMI